MLLRGRSGSFFGFAPEETSELHRSVNGFRAAVRKKDAVHPGPCGEFARERTLIRVMKKIRDVNGARGFAADYFHDPRMRVAKRVHGDAAQKIEVLFPRGIEDVCAAAVSQNNGLAFVCGQKELFGVEQARVRFGGFRRLVFELANGTRQGLPFRRSAHHAAERAACAADNGSRRTRVPGINATASVAGDSAACDASNKASGEVPPRMRTSRTPPSMARLAASSLRIMPPETTRH